MSLLKKKLNSSGFGHIELIVLTATIICLFGVGYYVIKHADLSKTNTYTLLSGFKSDGVQFSEEACITTQTGSAPNQIDTVVAKISANDRVGPSTQTTSHGKASGGYNPLAYYQINNQSPVTTDNWITGSVSTISFTIPATAESSSFSLGIKPNSSTTSSGSTQLVRSISLCQPSGKIANLSAMTAPSISKTTTTTSSSSSKSTTTSTTTNKKSTSTTSGKVSSPSPTISLTASSTSIIAGSSSTISWSSKNATSCSASNSWSGTKPTSGSASTGILNIPSSYTYTLNCTGGSGKVSANITITVGSKPKSLYSGKLLGMNTSLTATYNSQTTETGILNQLGVNSERGEIDFNGTSFGDPNGDGTIANWLDTLTSAGIVPLPLMNQYVALSTLNVTGFASSLTTWCKAYCAGGSFYNGNPSANSTYAPQTLEILNEPYGNWWGYAGPSNADVAAYATLLKDIRTDLNNAGLSSIGITAAASPQSFGTANWDSALLADGGFSVVQGIVVHAYGLVDLSSQTGGSSTNGWGMVYEEHDMLVNAGLSANANVYVTEDGWCTNQAAEPAGYTVGADCVDSYFITEAQKDSDITTVIGQLGSVSWLKGLWYYNLYPYSISGQWNSFGLYEPGTWNGQGLYVSGAATPAWAAFQSAAQANGL